MGRELEIFNSIVSQIFSVTTYQIINIGNAVPTHVEAMGAPKFQVVPGIHRELFGDQESGVRYAEQFFDVNVYFAFENLHTQIWYERDPITHLVPQAVRAMSGFSSVSYVFDSSRVISIEPPKLVSNRIGLVTFHCAYIYHYL